MPRGRGNDGAAAVNRIAARGFRGGFEGPGNPMRVGWATATSPFSRPFLNALKGHTGSEFLDLAHHLREEITKQPNINSNKQIKYIDKKKKV
jgi:hypothetical protein